LRCPQPGFLGFLLHRGKPRQGDVLVIGKILRLGLERQQVLLDKSAHPQAQLLDLGGKAKIHDRAPGAVSSSCHHDRVVSLRLPAWQIDILQDDHSSIG
jgi:hypothetical protein